MSTFVLPSWSKEPQIFLHFLWWFLSRQDGEEPGHHHTHIHPKCSCPKCSPAERRRCATVGLGPPGLWQDLDLWCLVPGLHHVLRNHNWHCSEKSSRASVRKDPTGQAQNPQTKQLSHPKTAAALRIHIVIAVGVRKRWHKLDRQQVEDFRLRDPDVGPTCLYYMWSSYPAGEVCRDLPVLDHRPSIQQTVLHIQQGGDLKSNSDTCRQLFWSDLGVLVHKYEPLLWSDPAVLTKPGKCYLSHLEHSLFEETTIYSTVFQVTPCSLKAERMFTTLSIA